MGVTSLAAKAASGGQVAAVSRSADNSGLVS